MEHPLPLDCSVLDLKSRFEIYGAISCIRIDRDRVGYITYQIQEYADAAIAAALAPSFGITISSKRGSMWRLWNTKTLASLFGMLGAKIRFVLCGGITSRTHRVLYLL
ncbi:hypothetical protein K1719_047540 [Acacia pycnantha]|nr:hypothetical protein K1719_047540 [Acacia pycnantha]